MKLIIPPGIQIKLPIQRANLIESPPRIASLEDFLDGLHTGNTDLVRPNPNNIGLIDFVQVAVGFRRQPKPVLVCGPELGERGELRAREAGERREVEATDQGQGDGAYEEDEVGFDEVDYGTGNERLQAG